MVSQTRILGPQSRVAFLQRNWRQALTLGLAWGSTLISAAYFWAASTYVHPGIYGNPDLVKLPTNYVFPDPRAVIPTVFLLLVVTAPVSLALLLRADTFRRVFSRVWGAFQSQRVLGILLIVYEAIDFGAARGGEMTPLAQVLIVSTLACIGVWLFVRREPVGARLLVLCITWLVAISIAFPLSLDVTGQIDIFSASLKARLYVLLVLGTTSSVALAPICLLTRVWSAQARLLVDRLTRQSPFWFIPVALGAVLLNLVYQLAPASQHVILRLLEGWVTLGLAIGSGAFILICLASVRDQRQEIIGRRSRLMLGVVTAAFATAFLWLAVQIGRNSIESLNPDAYSYLEIARKYAAGQLVVRGYWSPLASWLMAPGIALGADPRVMLRLVGGAAGAAWVLVAVLLARRTGLGPWWRLGLAVCMAAVALPNAFGPSTPDLLGAVFVGLGLYWLTDPALLRHPHRSGVLIGLAGALSYYGKYYNLAFSAAFILLYCGVLYIRTRGARPAILLGATSLGVLAVSVLPWIAAISIRYGALTVTTSGPISHAVIGPMAGGHTCGGNELCDMPSDILFPGEDPQPRWYAALQWSIFDSLDTFRRQIRIIDENLIHWGNTVMLNAGPLPLVGLLILAVVALAGSVEGELGSLGSWAFLAVLVYVLGYSLTYSWDFRYYLAIFPLLLITVLRVIEGLHRRVNPGHGALGQWAGRVLSVLLLTGPLVTFVSFGGLRSQVTQSANACLREGSMAMARYLVEPMAGTDRTIVDFVSYYVQKRSLGAFLPGTAPADADSVLRAKHVRTFIVPDGTDLATGLTAGYHYEVVTRQAICGKAFLVLRVPSS